MHFTELTQVRLLGSATIDSDGQWVMLGEIHNDSTEVAVLLWPGEEGINLAPGSELGNRTGPAWLPH